MQSLTLSYLAAYLLIGGRGLLLAWALALRLLLNRAYGDILPCLVGIFRVAFGDVIFQFASRPAGLRSTSGSEKVTLLDCGRRK